MQTHQAKYVMSLFVFPHHRLSSRLAWPTARECTCAITFLLRLAVQRLAGYKTSSLHRETVSVAHPKANSRVSVL